MSESQEERLQLLQKHLRACKAQSVVCGWIWFLAIVSVPVSVALGNKTIGFSGISFIVGSLTMFTALAAKKRHDEIQTMLGQIEFINNLAETVRDAAQSANDRPKYNTDHISMN